ncbi:beta strand repeat-containing protein [Luteolibacter soli]|uniref:Autotransporter-associated beta strand repeat-containing protein n=1 Tax=Luteolibacter soli TaxID=3135280 RepID=A0ABU9AT95_9BACT
MKQKPASRTHTYTRLSLLALGALTSVTSAVTRTWDGGGTGGTNMETLANWSGDVLPNGTNGDIAEWNGTVTGPLSLNYTGATANGLGAGNGIFLSLTSAQTDSVTMVQASGTTAMRLQNITIASGAGAFTFGNANAFTDGITLGSGTVNAHTFTNNSSNMASFGSDVRFAFGGAGAKTTTFAGSGNWTFSGKYGNGGTGSITTIAKSGTGTLTINNNIQGTNTGAAVVNPGNFHINGGTAVIDTSGVVTTTNFSSIGQSGTDVAVMTVKGNGSFISGGDLNAGDIGSSSGTLNVQDTASVSVGTGGGFFVGSANTAGSTASGTVNHSAGSVTVNRTNDGAFVIGGRNSAATGGSGTYNLSGTGTLTNAGNVFVGGYGTGSVVQTGGTFNNAGWVSIARQTSGTGSYNISGGALNQTGASMGIVVGELATGTLTVSGSGAVTTANTGIVRIGNGATGNGTVHLNGGTLTTSKVEMAAGTSTFNFNGGTLKANAANATYLQGLTTANVRNGGALIDTNGNNISIGQALLHSGIGGDAAVDGGLTKSGSGVLTLGGASTYNGPTSANAGSLIFGGSSTTGNITVADGVTLGGRVTNVNASVVSNTNNPNLTLGAAGATALAVNFNTLGNPTVPIFNLGTGTVTLNGTVDVSLSNTTSLTSTPNNTTLALVSYGSQGGAGSWNLTTPSAGHTIFALNPTATALYLNITANPVTWTGAVSNAWNDDALGAPNNWALPDTTGTDFINGDTVNFTNTASNFNVDISENITPGIVNFSNTTNPYTIGSTGSFGITSGSVNLNGSGSVTINNSNSYTGATTINAGSLTVNGSLTASPVTLNTGTLNLNNNNAIGPAALTINGGTLDSPAAALGLLTNPVENWNADFTFTGTNNLDLGTGVVNVGGTGDRTVSVTSTLTTGELRSVTTQGFTKQGPGTLVVTSDGTNTAGSNITGLLNVAAGTLQTNRATGVTGDFMAAGVTGSGTIVNGAATERWLFSNAAAGTFNFTGTLANGAAGALGFNKSGASTQTLSGNNTYSGTTSAAGGTLILTGANTLSGPTNITAGTLSITGTNSAGGAVSVNGSAATPALLNLQNSNALGTSAVTSINRNSGIQLQGGIILPNTVTFTLSNDGTTGATIPYAVGNLGGDNVINGNITLTAGGGSSIFQSDSGSLTLNGNVAIAAAQSSRGLILQGSSTGANAFNGVLGDLSGTSVGSIIKNGTGTWTVSGNNTYTGVTTVNAGTLIVTGNNTGASAVTVAANATLAGNGNLGGAVTIAANGIHSLAVAATSGAQVTRTIGGALTNTTGSVLNLTAAVAPAPGVYTLVTATGGISALPTTITGFTGGVVSISGNSLILTIASPSAYDAWALSKGLTGANNGPDQDNGDLDGIPNLLEYVLNGDPLASDTGNLPVATEDATNFYFDFNRRDDSISEVTLTFEYGTTLASWPSSVAIPSDNTPIAGPPVTITDNADGTHHVKITVAKSGEIKLFGRLSAVK